MPAQALIGNPISPRFARLYASLRSAFGNAPHGLNQQTSETLPLLSIGLSADQGRESSDAKRLASAGDFRLGTLEKTQEKRKKSRYRCCRLFQLVLTSLRLDRLSTGQTGQKRDTR
jgi:hypothetical protein